MKALRRLALMMALLLVALPVTTAATGDTPLAVDPALEAKVIRIADELRCLVCQNETIAASQAGLAVDLRREIRTLLQQGESEAQILDFMVQRYGEFIRYRPAFNPTTALLWVGPFALLGLGAFVFAMNVRRRRDDAVSVELEEAEWCRLVDLLGPGATRP